MERLTDPAQGYCEMYCKKYGHCFGDPGDCIFEKEVAMYDALKSIEGIVPFDRLLELALADKEERLMVLPCKVGDTVYSTLDDLGHSYKCEVTGVYLSRREHESYVELDPVSYRGSRYGASFGAFGKTVFLTREEAEAALEGGNT